MSDREEYAAALGEVIDDLEAHLRWRLGAGLSRLPPARAPATAAPAQGAVGSGPLGWQKGLGSPSLRALREDLGDCVRCKLAGGRTNLVFGVGNPQAELVFVGEGPGAEEDRQGEPFVGPAGELLTKMIGAMGFTRGEVYICNVVKCRPPENRDPEPEEVAACSPFLVRQLEAVAPKVIVGMGSFAARFLVGDPKGRITKMRGQWFSYAGIPMMPTYHPAYLLRNPAAKREVWQDLQDVMRKLGRNA